MTQKSSSKVKQKKRQKRHYFFPNPYQDCAFTKCPKCEVKTKVRKIPLVIHIEPKQLFLLNKQCKYCPNCDLIIAKKSEIESLMAVGLRQVNPQVIGNNYLVLGTLERKDWKEGDKGILSPEEIIERMYVFKDVWNFEVIPAGWHPS
ncbi:MAG: hypothetical protein AB4426_16780 [Xenococcaceae cyanobacterium]